ncbi:MAG: AAA family ATPase [Candidatus Nezhaarchaeota archaeon]|nr:AAA family ATPase [Candidatus Nezhaarchaeota archaeon]MCX8141647.1 AAA family ATPase [Candidatus Nezhaarchaeota archaeon]MDW8049914.1 AAA family ATPase [Nitrososphaerota archaeon]
MTLTVAVTGGKGGAGKSVIATNLAVTLSRMGYKVLLVDSDVDNPNDHLFLDVNLRRALPITVFTPGIDLDNCIRCGKCSEVCLERAIMVEGEEPLVILDGACSGCKACFYACPRNAIYDRGRCIGYIHVATRGNLRIMVGELRPTEAKSTLAVNKLVRVVREDVKREKYDFVVIDTSPGVHSAVIQALRIADVAIAVTEPTPLGLSTIKSTIDVLKALKLSWIAFINKSTLSDLYRNELLKTCSEAGAQTTFEMPYDEEVFKINMSYKLLVESEHPLRQVLVSLAEYIVNTCLRNKLNVE